MERLISLAAETANIMVGMAKSSLPHGMGDSELSIIQSFAESQKALAGAMELQTRVLDFQGDIPNDQESRPAGTFPKFGRLPAEIRKIIWHMALPESRAFVLYIGYPDKICLNQYYKPPSIRGVCKESWDVTEKNGGFEFANVQTETYGIWFNYSKDVVVWLEYDLYDQFMILKNIQNIAIEWHHFCDEDDCINTLQWVLETMPQCQSVILMTRPQLCNGPEDLDGCTAQLFSMNGTDVIPASSLGDTWAHVKKRLQALYHKRSTIRKLGTGAAELPIVEAKELIFNPKKVY